jgi:hypothetical protein
MIDVREGGPLRHALERRERALVLREDCIAWLPRTARILLPAMDGLTRRWIERSCSPYVAEIAAIASALEVPGIWFLNGSYEWGCTAMVRDEGGRPWLARTLDWPFPGLGRHLEIVSMRGEAGEYLNVTWPGYTGALTALAAGRFAAAVNQAPLRRRTRKPWLRPCDLAVNALQSWFITFCPPAHLLRHVFETCRSFREAKHRLEREPIARPAIFTLVGCERGERCVIERTEKTFSTWNEDAAVANDWREPTESWEPRVSPDALLTRSSSEASARNRARQEALASWSQPFASAYLAWVKPPVLNPCTRVAVEMCPGSGTLRVAGYEPEPDTELPRRATLLREVTALGIGA